MKEGRNMAKVSEQRQAKANEARSLVEQANLILADLNQEISDIKDSLEEKFSETERFQMVEAAATTLDESESATQEVMESLENIDFSW